MRWIAGIEIPHRTDDDGSQGWPNRHSDHVHLQIAPLGIRSLVVEPGMMRTNFLDPSTAGLGDIEIADYTDAMAGFRTFITHAYGARQNDPEGVSALIIAEASSPEPARRLLFGVDAHEWANAKCQELAVEIGASRARKRTIA